MANKVGKEPTYYGEFYADRGSGRTPVTQSKQISVTCFLQAALDNDESKCYRVPVSCTIGTFDDKAEAVQEIRKHRIYGGKDRWGCVRTLYGVGKCNYKGEIQLTTKDFSNPDLILPRIKEEEKAKLLAPENVDKAIDLYNKTLLG